MNIEINAAAAWLTRKIGVGAVGCGQATVGQIGGAEACNHDAGVRLSNGAEGVGKTLGTDRAQIVLSDNVEVHGIDAEDRGIVAGMEVHHG